ncbi:MAG: hypothetical protein ACRC6X_03770 [Culicoidibacterales bacterium]
MKNFFLTVMTESKKDVYTQSAQKAFKPVIDIIEALLKGARPFIVVLTALAIIIQLLKVYQQFNSGKNMQKYLFNILGILLCATLILTYNVWLIPILKKVAGI